MWSVQIERFNVWAGFFFARLRRASRTRTMISEAWQWYSPILLTHYMMSSVELQNVKPDHNVNSPCTRQTRQVLLQGVRVHCAICAIHKTELWKLCAFYSYSRHVFVLHHGNLIEKKKNCNLLQVDIVWIIACVWWPLTYPLSTRQMQCQTKSCVGCCASSWTGWRMSVISWQRSWAQKKMHMHFSRESTIYSNRNWMTK